MSRYFKKAELADIYDIYKEIGYPLPDNFKERYAINQNKILYNRLCADGYTGTKRVSQMLDFIDQYIERKEQEQRELKQAWNSFMANYDDIKPTTQKSHAEREAARTYENVEEDWTNFIRDYDEDLEQPARLNPEIQVQIEDKQWQVQEVRNVLKDFEVRDSTGISNVDSWQYLPTLDIDPNRTFTLFQTQVMNRLFSQKLDNFLRNIKATDQYQMTMGVINTYKDDIKVVQKNFTLTPDFIKRLRDEIKKGNFLKHRATEWFYEGEEGAPDEYEVGFSSTSLIECWYWHKLQWIEFVKLNVNPKELRDLEMSLSGSKYRKPKSNTIADTIESMQSAANSKQNKRNDGAFCRYFLTGVPSPVADEAIKCQIFTRKRYNRLLSIKQKDYDTTTEYLEAIAPVNECCLIYALSQYRDENGNAIPEHILTALRQKINDRTIDCYAKTRLILLDHGINVTVKNIDDKSNNGYANKFDNHGSRKKQYDNALFTVPLLNWRNHWILEQRLNLTKSYLENFNTRLMLLPNANPNYQYNGTRWKYSKDHLITASNFIRWLERHNKFTPMSMYDLSRAPFMELPDIEETGLSPNLHPQIYCRSLKDIKAIKAKVREETKPKKYSFENYTIMAGDFETITHGIPIHDKDGNITGHVNTPYQFVVGDMRCNMKVYNGLDCFEQFLEDPQTPKRIIMYFHNLTFDWSFMAKYGAKGKAVTPHGKVYQATIETPKHTIIVKDSLPLFQCKLEKLPEMFGLTNLHKDVCPYEYYTQERLDNGGIGNIEEAAALSSNPEQFKRNCFDLHFNVSATEFDMYKYSAFYCKKDVEILMKSLLAMDKDARTNLGTDENDKDFSIFSTLTTPAMSNKYFEKHVFLSNPDIKALSGEPAAFIRKCIHGGRCMSAWSKKWYFDNVKMQDNDAVSLYPSAMARMSIPLGCPKLWNPTINLKDPKIVAYFVKVRFYPIVREYYGPAVVAHYPFPLIPHKPKDSNSLQWTDSFTTPITVYLSNVALEDIEEHYPDIKYDIIEGLYYNEGVDVSIRDAIKKVFDRRKQMQAIHNPAQAIYKLILNSCYGKMIQKNIRTTTHYVPTSDYVKFIIKHYNNVKESQLLDNSKIWRVELYKPITDQYSFVHAGVLVLDWSKRIMNEVMCLAYKIGCRVFYQDTDSTHIYDDDVNYLAKVYEQKYHRKLIGKQMGQFHNDFESKLGDVLYADKTVILGKKMYYDRLLTKKGYDYHKRMKGVCAYAIDTLAGSNDPAKVYDTMFKGDSVSFNLVEKFHPKFKLTKSALDITLTDFIRDLRCTLPKGNINEYYQP